MTARDRSSRLMAWVALVGAVALCVGVGSASAAWPGQNGPIVFTGGSSGTASGLWSITSNGSRLRQLTSNGSDSEVQTSADGRWIVFARSVSVGGESARHIFVARANGSGAREVTTGPVSDRSPSFTRNGRRILFSRFISSGSDEKSFGVEHIFSVGRNGGGLRRLTSGRFTDRNPVMSPNGRIVAFERAGITGVEPHVYTMRANGTQIRDATPRLAAWTAEPDFSPSGNRIVFVRGYPGSATAELFTMRPNGRGMSRLTGRPGRPVGFFASPSYSPNGRFVVAQRTNASGGSPVLQVFRVRDGRRVGVLGGSRTPRTPEMQGPAWLTR